MQPHEVAVAAIGHVIACLRTLTFSELCLLHAYLFYRKKHGKFEREMSRHLLFVTVFDLSLHTILTGQFGDNKPH